MGQDFRIAVFRCALPTTHHSETSMAAYGIVVLQGFDPTVFMACEITRANSDGRSTSCDQPLGSLKSLAVLTRMHNCAERRPTWRYMEKRINTIFGSPHPALPVSGISMNRLLSIFVFSVVGGSSFSSSSQEIYITCSLTGPQNMQYQYSFAFDSDESTLFWIEGTQHFQVIRNTSTQLWASHEKKFGDFPHDETHFRLNRVTGAAEMQYLLKPSAADIYSCKKTRNSGCEDLLVLTEKSEHGTCRVVDQAIK